MRITHDMGEVYEEAYSQYIDDLNNYDPMTEFMAGLVDDLIGEQLTNFYADWLLVPFPSDWLVVPLPPMD